MYDQIIHDLAKPRSVLLLLTKQLLRMFSLYINNVIPAFPINPHRAKCFSQPQRCILIYYNIYLQMCCSID